MINILLRGNGLMMIIKIDDKKFKECDLNHFPEKVYNSTHFFFTNVFPLLFFNSSYGILCLVFVKFEQILF